MPSEAGVMSPRSLIVGARRIALYLGLTLLAIPFLLPLLAMLSTAFNTPQGVYAVPPQWIPGNLTLDNFRESWRLMDVPGLLRNSALVAAASTVGTVLSSSLAGYAFAFLPARGRRFLFSMLVLTMIVPPTVTLLPQFLLFSKLGWVNTFWPLIVPSLLGNAFYIFLFRQFFRTLPIDLFECAELDGCNPLATYLRIALPLSRPAIAAVAVFAFIGAWNDFLAPLVYLNTNARYTLSLGLSLFQGLYQTQLHYLMPMALVALIPVVALFLVCQPLLERSAFGRSGAR